MTVFIPGGTKWPCPVCKRLQLFQRPIPQEALPVTVKCGFVDCQYKISFSTLDADTPPTYPKLGPDQRVQGNWTVEIQEQQRSYWKTAMAEGKQVSFHDRADAIAGHLAGGLECIQSLKYDLEQLSDAMAAQFEGEWGVLTSFQRCWNPHYCNQFIKQPFLALATLAQDEFVKQRTRLVLHPKFFVQELGFFVPATGGFLIQLITPYSQFSFPVERWMAAVLDLPEPLQLRVSGNKIVGKHLFSCWADIPGTVPDIDHHPDAPSLKISNGLLARRWLASAGVAPWNSMPLEQSVDFLPSGIDFFRNSAQSQHRRAWTTFAECGKLAYFVPSSEQRVSAWEFAITVGAYGIGQKLCLITDPFKKDLYANLWRETAGATTMSRHFHWKVVKDQQDLADTPWDSFKYILVDYTPDMPIEICRSLAEYNGRVILISDDPLLDTLESNVQASSFYACVNGIAVEQRLPAAEAEFNYDLVEHTLVSAILRDWRKS
jgi:hypothetical protein